MEFVLIAIFWSSSTSSIFTVEFSTEAACKDAGYSYAEMVDQESMHWVASAGKVGVLAPPVPGHASYICKAKGS